MDLADLVGAPAVKAPRSVSRRLPTRARTLLLFAACGLALLGLQRAFETPERPRLAVRLPADADGAARERLIDEAVLVEVGLGLGWRTDPLIRDRLLRTIAVLTPSPEAPLDRAAALDLPRRDPLVRARLAERARRRLPEPDAPSDAALARFLESHPERFARPLTLTFEHRFTTDPARARAMLTTTDPGEPELTLGPRPTRSLPALERALGPDAARALAAAPRDRWTLVTSTIGHHLVRVVDRSTPPAPTLSEIRPEVLAAWRDETRAALHHEALKKLRAGFDLELERIAPSLTEATR